MPPKPERKEKPLPQAPRPRISDSSLVHVPIDAVEGFQERIETGINWTHIETAARHHKKGCLKNDLPHVPFSQALHDKIKKSILNGFLDEESGLTLEQQWEFLLPIILWDVEKFANEEAKTCFNSINCITDDIIKLIKKTVKIGDRKVLKRELKAVSILRVNDTQMTELDSELLEFKKLRNLNLCGNYLKVIDGTVIPHGLRSLELQSNRIKDDIFVEQLPTDLLYLGLARNLLCNECIEPLGRLPFRITILDLTDNDIYSLEPLLDALARLPNLRALSLAGNPCAVCTGYARTTLMKIQGLKWLDSCKVLPSNRPTEPINVHPDDLRSSYFNFTIFRIISAPQPPKLEKGAVTTFHVELELPLLDAKRRQFLMFRKNTCLVEILPPPEDDDWTTGNVPSKLIDNMQTSPHESDIYNHLVTKNTREICNYTTLESNRVQWSKIMNFQEPSVRIFCPDLFALRDTFRTIVTLRLIYSVTITGKQGKSETNPSKKKSLQAIKLPGEQRMTLATIRCALRQPEWNQPSQHFHWDNSLGTNDAVHWGDGDLSVLQYSQTPVKVVKGKQETDIGTAIRQPTPEILTCHFGFGIDTLKA